MKIGLTFVGSTMGAISSLPHNSCQEKETREGSLIPVNLPASITRAGKYECARAIWPKAQRSVSSAGALQAVKSSGKSEPATLRTGAGAGGGGMIVAQE